MERQIHRSDPFNRFVKQLVKKQRDFEKTVSEALTEIAKTPIPADDQIPGLGGAPVFKRRLPYGNKGKRGGARLIYYCAEALVVPLFLYSKNDIEDVQPATILDALRNAGLIEEADDSAQPT